MGLNPGSSRSPILKIHNIPLSKHHPLHFSLKNFDSPILSHVTYSPLNSSIRDLILKLVSLELFLTFLRVYSMTSWICLIKTSSHNGAMKRKQSILLDITCRLLYEIHVSHYLWSEVIMPANYLHNRLPSSPLGDAIPLTRLFPHASLFPSPLLCVWIHFVC